MSYYRLFNEKQRVLLKRIIGGCILLGKGDPLNRNSFFVRVITRFNMVSSGAPLRFGVSEGNYDQAKKEFRALVREVIEEVNSFDIKEKFKVSDCISIVTPEMMKGAQQAEIRHRRVLGEDY